LTRSDPIHIVLTTELLQFYDSLNNVEFPPF